MTGATSTTFTVTPATANKLSFVTQPSTAVAGVAISPAVTLRVEDSFGNLTPSTATVAVALTTPGSATLSGALSQTAVAGTVSFNILSVNKIGTYSVAVNAHFHEIPFYVAAPSTTVDFGCPGGESIPIETRAGTEVQGYGGELWSTPDTATFNPAFDITPGRLVTKFILEKGIFGAAELTRSRG